MNPLVLAMVAAGIMCVAEPQGPSGHSSDDQQETLAFGELPKPVQVFIQSARELRVEARERLDGIDDEIRAAHRGRVLRNVSAEHFRRIEHEDRPPQYEFGSPSKKRDVIAGLVKEKQELTERLASEEMFEPTIVFRWNTALERGQVGRIEIGQGYFEVVGVDDEDDVVVAHIIRGDGAVAPVPPGGRVVGSEGSGASRQPKFYVLSGTDTSEITSGMRLRPEGVFHAVGTSRREGGTIWRLVKVDLDPYSAAIKHYATANDSPETGEYRRTTPPAPPD